MWSTSSEFQVWLLNSAKVGHGLMTCTGGFMLPLELDRRLFAADYTRFDSVGTADDQLSWVVVRST